MPSLDFVYDLVEKLEEDNIEYLVLTLKLTRLNILTKQTGCKVMSLTMEHFIKVNQDKCFLEELMDITLFTLKILQ